MMIPRDEIANDGPVGIEALGMVAARAVRLFGLAVLVPRNQVTMTELCVRPAGGCVVRKRHTCSSTVEIPFTGSTEGCSTLSSFVFFLCTAESSVRTVTSIRTTL